ncbi:putative glycolipid-binding domain-containing protein [Microbacteriaceae bacterium VKM Ac-2855]|nr:putative glycolipid-binding domain-containing protein [Microbacteriaceae bacterium VKM Ac-2855]
MPELAWRRLDEPGIERTRVVIDADGFRAEGDVEGDVEGGDLTLHYALECDASWRTRRLELRVGDRIRILTSAGGGSWSDGAPLPELAGALDVDVSATPLTNVLPIRRLSLSIGASAEIVTVYVDVPSLTVTPDPQRYTRLAERVYRYESLDSDFTRDIEVDADGFVLVYPGLFERLP